MSAFTAISSMIELAVIIFLIYGFYKEDKFIAFEQKVKMIIVVNYRREKSVLSKCVKTVNSSLLTAAEMVPREAAFT